MQLQWIFLCWVIWTWQVTSFDTNKLFPVELDLAYTPSDLDAAAFDAEFVLPINEDESIISISENKLSSENIECKLGCIAYETEVKEISLPLSESGLSCFDPLTLNFYTWESQLKVFKLNKTSQALEEVQYSNIPQNSLNFTDALNSHPKPMRTHSLTFNEDQSGDARAISLIFCGQIVTVLDHSIKSRLFSFNLEFGIEADSLIKLSDPIGQSKLFVIVYQPGAAHISVYHVDLNSRDEKVLSTTIDIEFLVEAVKSRGVSTELAFDVAVYKKSEMHSPIILLLSRHFGLFKFNDLRSDGNFQLQTEETQFIFGNLLAVENKTVIVIKANPASNESQIELYKMHSQSTALIK